MAVVMQVPQPAVMSAADALWTLIASQPKKVREVLSIRLAEDTMTSNRITPELARQIQRARQEYQRGETIRCSTPEEMERYFESL